MTFRAPNYEKRTAVDGWKSDQQKLKVLGRLASTGKDVSSDTTASDAWKQITQLFLDQLKASSK